MCWHQQEWHKQVHFDDQKEFTQICICNVDGLQSLWGSGHSWSGLGTLLLLSKHNRGDKGGPRVFSLSSKGDQCSDLNQTEIKNITILQSKHRWDPVKRLWLQLWWSGGCRPSCWGEKGRWWFEWKSQNLFIYIVWHNLANPVWLWHSWQAN